MNDNLAHLIQNEQVGAQTPATDFESHEKEKEETQENLQVEQSLVAETSTNNVINVTMLSDWFEENDMDFDKVRRMKVRGQFVNPERRILFSVVDPKSPVDEEGNHERVLEVVKGANKFPVLDVPAFDMDIFGNGFQIMYSFEEDLVLKCYGIKTGLIIVYCLHINDQLIPYDRVKLKKKDTELIISQPNREYITSQLNSQLDLEGFQIQYKQVQKELDKISDKQSAITWLLDKQSSVRDINHLLQIDDILTWMIS